MCVYFYFWQDQAQVLKEMITVWTNMEPIKRDMELLSNSMATYAHIKGKTSAFFPNMGLETPSRGRKMHLQGHRTIISMTLI